MSEERTRQRGPKWEMSVRFRVYTLLGGREVPVGEWVQDVLIEDGTTYGELARRLVQEGYVQDTIMQVLRERGESTSLDLNSLRVRHPGQAEELEHEPIPAGLSADEIDILIPLRGGW